MVSKDYSDAVIQNTFHIHHIASFVEGEQTLKPEDVVRHSTSLQESRKIEEVSCAVKMDTRGMRVKLEKTKETVELFEWSGVKNQAAILNPLDNFEFKYLVFFRLVQIKDGVNELHVFSCDTPNSAKSFVDSISYYKKNARRRSLSESRTSFDGSTLEKANSGKLDERGNTIVDAYSRHFHMLNRCIDDIEHFERRLEKALKKRGNSLEDIHNQPLITAPASHELIDVVRKVKYAFNTNEAIRPYTPERTSKKLFIRLFNTVQWLDEVCRSGFVPEYDRNMVANVAEPYLNAETISAITERLGTKRQEFWQSLGPNWTTPSEQISNQKERYIPTFDTSVRESPPQQQPLHRRPSSTIGQVTRTPSSGSVVATNKKQVAQTEIPVDEAKTQKFCEDVEKNGGRLYYATVRHVGSKPKEINVAPGTVLEVLDSTGLDWWTVRDQNGTEGEIPRWKLQEYSTGRRTTLLQTSPGPSHLMQKAEHRMPQQTITTKSSGYRSPVRAKTPEQELPSRQSPVVSNIAPKNPSPPPVQVQGPHISVDSDVEATAEASKASEPSFSKRQQNASGSMSMDLSQPTKSPSPQTASHSQFSIPQGNMIYMTAEQIQELLKGPNRNTQLPVVIVPMNELQNYTSQTNVSSGVNGNMSFFDTSVPMQWPELNDMREPMVPARLPTPPILSSYGGAPLAEPLGFSRYPFNYPTHMHTMTRELRERLSKMREGGGTGLRSVPSPTTTSERPYGRLTKYSSKEDVAEWLVAHGFPPKVLASMQGFNGMDLYTMNRAQLMEHVGPERCDELFYAFRGS